LINSEPNKAEKIMNEIIIFPLIIFKNHEQKLVTGQNSETQKIIIGSSFLQDPRDSDNRI